MAKKVKSKSSPNTELAEALNQLLADEQVLILKTKRAHWNVEGPDFYSMHKFFEAQYEELGELSDEIAERIRQIGHYTVGSMHEYLELTHLSEIALDSTNSLDFIQELAMSHEEVIVFLKKISERAEELKDLSTHDFLVGVLQIHEKMFWMLNAHLK